MKEAKQAVLTDTIISADNPCKAAWNYIKGYKTPWYLPQPLCNHAEVKHRKLAGKMVVRNFCSLRSYFRHLGAMDVCGMGFNTYENDKCDCSLERRRKQKKDN